MGLRLSAADVAVLEARTEGWIVSLQLAALSMQGREDLRAFIGPSPATTGTSSTTWSTKSCTVSPTASVPSCCRPRSSTGSAPRCAMRSPAGTMAGACWRPWNETTCSSCRWTTSATGIRYHHLFADVLRARALAEQPRQVPVLHQQASAWFERHGTALRRGPARAGRRGLRARGGPARAWPPTTCAPAGRRRPCGGGSMPLPDETFAARPVLAISPRRRPARDEGRSRASKTGWRPARRWVAAAAGERERAEPRLPAWSSAMTQVLAHLPSAIAMYRAAIARMRGDADATIASARAAFEAAGPDQPLDAAVPRACWPRLLEPRRPRGRPTRHRPTPSRTSRWPGIARTSSAARSRWPTSGSPGTSPGRAADL